jgi:hypothetical protein
MFNRRPSGKYFRFLHFYCLIIAMLIIAMTISEGLSAQKSFLTTEILSANQVTILLPDTLRSSLDIKLPVKKVYTYSDKSGQYYIVLTESGDSISPENRDTINYQIKAVALKMIGKKLIKIWEVNDHIDKKTREENNIWFWTKYIAFKDYDKDSLIDPIIVYGTTSMNGYDDGRIKFLIFYKNSKIAIRHQNGVLDDQRETQIEKLFYALPQGLQNSVKAMMESMIKNGQALFPYGWQKAMKDKKTFISERKQ